MSRQPDYRFITLRRDGLAVHRAFNRPDRRNALNHAMMGEIGDAVDRVGDLGAMSELPPGA